MRVPPTDLTKKTRLFKKKKSLEFSHTVFFHVTKRKRLNDVNWESVETRDPRASSARRLEAEVSASRRPRRANRSANHERIKRSGEAGNKAPPRPLFQLGEISKGLRRRAAQ